MGEAINGQGRNLVLESEGKEKESLPPSSPTPWIIQGEMEAAVTAIEKDMISAREKFFKARLLHICDVEGCTVVKEAESIMEVLRVLQPLQTSHREIYHSLAVVVASFAKIGVLPTVFTLLGGPKNGE